MNLKTYFFQKELRIIFKIKKGDRVHLVRAHSEPDNNKKWVLSPINMAENIYKSLPGPSCLPLYS